MYDCRASRGGVTHATCYASRFQASHLARVVKLVDTGDLKSPDHCDRAGSSPAPGTTGTTIKHRFTGVYFPAFQLDSLVRGGRKHRNTSYRSSSPNVAAAESVLTLASQGRLSSKSWGLVSGAQALAWQRRFPLCSKTVLLRHSLALDVRIPCSEDFSPEFR